jgi:hypothetical protein
VTSPRKIDANRRNAEKSTGPTTEQGKQRSRCNAVRHGLTAETVVQHLEDAEDYKAFQLSVTADFDAQTAVERELVLRLASLLWRLRRATAIETGILQIQSDAGRGGEPGGRAEPIEDPVVHAFVRMRELVSAVTTHSNHDPEAIQARMNNEMAARFLALCRVDNGAFERLNRYETALWRQVCQVLLTLEFLTRNRSF